MINMIEFEEILNSYNLAIQRKFEEKMHDVRNPEDYSALMNEARLDWEKKLILGKLPKEHFSDINSGNFLEFLQKAAVICDEFIPVSLAEKLNREVNPSKIAELAKAGDSMEVMTAAIELLGLSGDASYSDALADLLYNTGEYSDLLAERARKALVQLGPESSSYIEKRLANIKKPGGSDFHLIIALIEIDEGKKSEATYSILRDAFKNTDEKALAARCLADYGDGRAVALLRGYLAKNQEKTDKDTVLEIQGAILNLGGSLEGLG